MGKDICKSREGEGHEETSGKSSLFLITLSTASTTNLILDPIFIFGLLGFPRMETLGAAIATVIGQIVGMIAGVVYGICIKIFNVVSVGSHGINNGLIPIVAYNFGAKQPERIRDAVKWAILRGF